MSNGAITLRRVPVWLRFLLAGLLGLTLLSLTVYQVLASDPIDFVSGILKALARFEMQSDWSFSELTNLLLLLVVFLCLSTQEAARMLVRGVRRVVCYLIGWPRQDSRRDSSADQIGPFPAWWVLIVLTWSISVVVVNAGGA